jgi:hypothetical protein
MSTPLSIGDPLPWLELATDREPALMLDALAGRAVLLSAPADPASITAGTAALAPVLDGTGFWLIVCAGRDRGALPAAPHRHARMVADPDGSLTALVGAGRTLAANAALRVVAIAGTDAAGYAAAGAAAAQDHGRDADGPSAPALLLPDVIEPDLCRALIERWERDGHSDTGYLREDAAGTLVHVVDQGRKRRSDHYLDPAQPLYRTVHERIHRRVAPWIERAFHFSVRFAESYRIACYSGADGGFFTAHRDFGKGHPYRHFAMSVNLNADYTGGELRFPEFGRQLHRPPAGGAIVYSGALMHEVLPVTAGRRFVLINFLTGHDGANAVSDYQQRHGAAVTKRS